MQLDILAFKARPVCENRIDATWGGTHAVSHPEQNYARCQLILADLQIQTVNWHALPFLEKNVYQSG